MGEANSSLFLWVHKSERPCGQNGAGRNMGGASCKNKEVTGQIWSVWVFVCLCVCACVQALEEEKRENKKERKREREVWYHQLNNPPTQILVLSLKPSVSFPTVVRWFSAFSFLFFSFLSFLSAASICLFLSLEMLAHITEWSFSPSARTPCLSSTLKILKG